VGKGGHRQPRPHLRGLEEREGGSKEPQSRRLDRLEGGELRSQRTHSFARTARDRTGICRTGRRELAGSEPRGMPTPDAGDPGRYRSLRRGRGLGGTMRRSRRSLLVVVALLGVVAACVPPDPSLPPPDAPALVALDIVQAGSYAPHLLTAHGHGGPWIVRNTSDESSHCNESLLSISHCPSSLPGHRWHDSDDAGVRPCSHDAGAAHPGKR